MYWIVSSVYYLGCMVVNINVLFAFTEPDYFQILFLEILSSIEPTIYFGRVYSVGKNFTGKINPDVVLLVKLKFTGKINPELILPVKQILPLFYQ